MHPKRKNNVSKTGRVACTFGVISEAANVASLETRFKYIFYCLGGQIVVFDAKFRKYSLFRSSLILHRFGKLFALFTICAIYEIKSLVTHKYILM